MLPRFGVLGTVGLRELPESHQSQAWSAKLTCRFLAVKQTKSRLWDIAAFSGGIAAFLLMAAADTRSYARATSSNGEGQGVAIVREFCTNHDQKRGEHNNVEVETDRHLGWLMLASAGCQTSTGISAAKGAALGAATSGSAAAGAAFDGTAGAIRSSNASKPTDTCYNIATDKQVACSR